jgi:probable F420-dependent oxidoreductase
MASGLKPQGMPPPDEFRRLGAAVEELGWDSVWVADRIASPDQGSPLLEGVVTAAAFAGFTHTIPIGLCVLVAPVRHPFLLAKQLATLDFLSGGRLQLGLGIGINPADYAAVEQPFRRRGRLADELIPALRAAWGEGPATFIGEHYRFEGVWLEPPPLQPGGPPIWMGGISEPALRRAARQGAGWMAFQVTADQFAEGAEKARRYAAEEGRDPGSLQMGILMPVHCRADGQVARSEAQDSFSRRWRRPIPMEVIESMCVVGTSEECVAKLADYARAGVRDFVLNPQAWSLDPVSDCRQVYADVVEPARRASA